MASPLSTSVLAQLPREVRLLAHWSNIASHHAAEWKGALLSFGWTVPINQKSVLTAKWQFQRVLKDTLGGLQNLSRVFFETDTNKT